VTGSATSGVGRAGFGVTGLFVVLGGFVMGGLLV
jgi:hypothetical protein